MNTGPEQVPSRWHNRRGFTLIELLVVIGILGLLLGASIIAFQEPSDTSRQRAAVTQLRSAVTLARQWAVSHRIKTYVVFPDAAVATDDPAKAYRSYNIYSDNEGYLREWSFLPQGVVFHASYGAAGGGTNALVVGNPYSNFTVGYPNLGTPCLARCIGFLPNGRLNQTGGYAVEVFVTGGYALPGSTSINYYTNSPVTGLQVHPLTGQTKVREY